MKSLKNILFLILSMLVFSTSIAQTCLFNDLVDDLVQQNSSFQAFVESEKGFRSWKILATEAPSLRTDMQELTLVLNNLELIENVGTKNYKSWKLLKEAGSKYVFMYKKLNLKCKTTKNNVINSYKEDYFFDRKIREDRVLDDLDRLFQN